MILFFYLLFLALMAGCFFFGFIEAAAFFGAWAICAAVAGAAQYVAGKMAEHTTTLGDRIRALEEEVRSSKNSTAGSVSSH